MREKKSETLEVRLPHSQKRAFMAACEARGTTASEEVRGFIAEFLTSRERAAKLAKEATMTIRRNPLKSTAALTALAGSGLVLSTMPSAAQDPVFGRLDRDGSGSLSVAEIPADDSGARGVFGALDTDGSGAVSPDEFLAKGYVVRREDAVTERNGEAIRTIGTLHAVFDLSGEQRTTTSITSCTETVPLSLTPAQVELRRAEMEADCRPPRDALGRHGITAG